MPEIAILPWSDDDESHRYFYRIAFGGKVHPDVDFELSCMLDRPRFHEKHRNLAGNEHSYHFDSLGQFDTQPIQQFCFQYRISFDLDISDPHHIGWSYWWRPGMAKPEHCHSDVCGIPYVSAGELYRLVNSGSDHIVILGSIQSLLRGYPVGEYALPQYIVTDETSP